MTESFLIVLLLTISTEYLLTKSHIVVARVADGYNVAGAIVSAVEKSVDNITTTTAEKQNRSRSNFGLYFQNVL